MGSPHALAGDKTHPHPIANGMVECFHWQLKASLKCQQTPQNWVNALPLELLGIRTALKEDLKCSTAELVHGTTLWLPGEFFDSSKTTNHDPTEYTTKLKTAMNNCVPLHHANHNSGESVSRMP